MEIGHLVCCALMALGVLMAAMCLDGWWNCWGACYWGEKAEAEITMVVVAGGCGCLDLVWFMGASQPSKHWFQNQPESIFARFWLVPVGDVTTSLSHHTDSDKRSDSRNMGFGRKRPESERNRTFRSDSERNWQHRSGDRPNENTHHYRC